MKKQRSSGITQIENDRQLGRRDCHRVEITLLGEDESSGWQQPGLCSAICLI
jgi:hypothetical protein